jgi:hypothetical protein
VRALWPLCLLGRLDARNAPTLHRQAMAATRLLLRYIWIKQQVPAGAAHSAPGRRLFTLHAVYYKHSR